MTPEESASLSGDARVELPGASLRWLPTARWLVAGFYVLLLSYFLMVPDPWAIFGRNVLKEKLPDHRLLQDLLMHAATYLVMTLLLLWALGNTTGRWATAILLFAIAHGALAEWLQGMVPGRSTDWLDWLADSAGVLACWLALRMTGLVDRAAPDRE